MSEQVAQLLGTLATNLDLIFVAVVVGQIKRGQGWMGDDGPEELDSAFGLDVVAAEAEMDQSLVVTLHYFSELLQPSVSEAILAEIKLSKLGVVLDDLANDMNSLVAQSHVTEVELACALLFVVLDDHVEEAEHLLLRRVDDQVLALGDVELQEVLLLDAFDLRHMLHLVAELADVNLLNRNGHDGSANSVVVIRVARVVALPSRRLLARAHS